MNIDHADLYIGDKAIAEDEELYRRARAARKSPRMGLFMDLSEIPIPSSVPRFYTINPAYAPKPTPRQVWKARRRCGRRKEWIRDLSYHYGKEGAERIAFWLR